MGGGSKRVKERWTEDGSGQKNGTYIKYDREGNVIAKYTYLHGVKDGPASYIDEYGHIKWHMPCRFVGAYKQGKKVGIWQLYLSALGQSFPVKRDVTENYDDAGYLNMRVKWEGDKVENLFTYNKLGKRSGEARYYSLIDNTVYAKGDFQADKPVGIWQNATVDNNGNIICAQGHKIEFEDGVAITLTNSAGKIRSLKDEARNNEAQLARYEADRMAKEAAAPKHYERIEIHGIEFSPDSYLLTKKGSEAITSIAHAINERAGSEQQVSTIYFSTHTTESRYSASDSTRKMKYILSLNRAFAVKTLLQEQLKDKSIKIVAYACGDILDVSKGDLKGFTNDVRVQMSFDDEPLTHAQTAYAALVAKYGIQVMDYIMPNRILRRSILEVVDAYFQDETIFAEMQDAEGKKDRKDYFHKIPRELWLATPFSDKYGEANPAAFRAEVESLFAKWSKKYGLMRLNQGKGLSPSVLFQEELEQYLAQKAD